MINLDPILLSFKLALLTVVVLIIIGLPISYSLYKSKTKFKPIIESIISLPLILPPSVLGFYLLLLFSPSSWFSSLGISLPFSFVGILIASVISSLPFMIPPILKALEQFPTSYINLSYTLGKGEAETFWKVILPNIKYAIISGIVMVFAHTMGEFGVILMIGGNIPGETRVASLAIYSELEALNYNNAHTYSFILLTISVTVILLLNILGAKKITE